MPRKRISEMVGIMGSGEDSSLKVGEKDSGDAKRMEKKLPPLYEKSRISRLHRPGGIRCPRKDGGIGSDLLLMRLYTGGEKSQLQILLLLMDSLMKMQKPLKPEKSEPQGEEQRKKGKKENLPVEPHMS
jgi:hypothetical protein